MLDRPVTPAARQQYPRSPRPSTRELAFLSWWTIKCAEHPAPFACLVPDKEIERFRKMERRARTLAIKRTIANGPTMARNAWRWAKRNEAMRAKIPVVGWTSRGYVPAPIERAREWGRGRGKPFVVRDARSRSDHEWSEIRPDKFRDGAINSLQDYDAEDPSERLCREEHAAETADFLQWAGPRFDRCATPTQREIMDLLADDVRPESIAEIYGANAWKATRDKWRRLRAEWERDRRAGQKKIAWA